MFRFLLAVLLASLVFVSASANYCRYRLVDLGPGSPNQRLMLDRKGHVYSQQFVDGKYGNPVRWNGSAWEALTGFPTNLTIDDVSADGTLVGTVYGPTYDDHRGYVWKKGLFKTLPLPTQFPLSYASAISPNGRYVVGHCASDPRSVGRIFRYDTKKRQTLVLYEFGTGYGVNDNGEFTGLVFGPGLEYLYYRYTNGGGMKILGRGAGSAISRTGAIVGDSKVEGFWLPFYTDKSGNFEFLGYVDPASRHGQAMAINSHGEVVGRSANSAYHWTKGTGLQTLDAIVGDPNWNFQVGLDINERGQIVGQAAKGGEWYRVFLLVPY